MRDFSVEPAIAIPKLEVIKPEPSPEPESASVQMLRALLADRRREKDAAESSKKSRLAQADEAERRAADLRERAATDDTHIATAEASINDILADIKKLGGRSE